MLRTGMVAGIRIYGTWELCKWYRIKGWIVLVLAGIVLIFFLVAAIGSYSGFRMRIMS